MVLILATRREFLKAGTATDLGLAVRSSENTNYSLIGERQRILDDIVREEFSPFAGKVMYDHHSSLSTREKFKDMMADVKNPDFTDYLGKFGNDPDLQELKEDIELLRRMPDLLLVPSMHILLSLYKQSVYATTKLDARNMGRGIKPNIFIFPELFETFLVETKHGEYEIPLEKRLRVTLNHEYEHAKHMYNGIDLGNGLIIDNSNCSEINPRIIDYVTETEAYFAGVNRAGNLSTDDIIYWYALSQLIGYNKKTIKKLKEMKLPNFERKLIEAQQDKVAEIDSEYQRIKDKWLH